MTHRVAAIDCGTNSIRLLIADITPESSAAQRDTERRLGTTGAATPAPLEDVTRQMRIVRLGEGVDRTGCLSPAALDRTMTALSEYAGLIAEARPEAIRMVATSATRDAANSREFTDRVLAILGVAPEVISGDDEAWLSFTGATRELAGAPLATAGMCPPPYLVTDIGGGSTEFILGGPGEARDRNGIPRDRLSGRSVNIGCVRMTERHLHGDPPLPAEIAATIKDIDAALELAAEGVPVKKARTLVGLAGSVTTVAAIELGLVEYDSVRIHHSRVSAARVHEIAGDLLAMTRADRAAIPVMHPGRVDVIGAGALILDRIMTRFGLAEVLVSEHDILDGIAWSLVGSPQAGLPRMDSGRRRYLVFVGEAVRGGPVAPGTGWPDDPADAATPVAASPADVRSLAAGSAGLAELTARQSVCRACPRLVAWREDVAAVRRKSFMDEPYWGRPIPGWGDPEPAILILGLAPAAHGGNRTGRIFTGDRSGDFLFASLHRCGLAAKPTSVTAGDGQRLTGVRMAAAVRCAPPENKPRPGERDACAPWLAAEFQLITPTLRVVVCLGGFAWQALWPVLAECGYLAPRPRPAFGHGVQVRVSGPAARPLLLLGCYHPSQQNTFTGRVTPAMTDAVFQAAREAAGLGLRPPRRPPDAPARAPRRGWRRGSETFASPQPRPGRVPAASRDDRRSPKSSSGQVMRIQGNIGRHDTPPIGDRRRWRLNCLLAARIRLPGCVPYLRI